VLDAVVFLHQVVDALAGRFDGPLEDALGVGGDTPVCGDASARIESRFAGATGSSVSVSSSTSSP